jgi:hypothetical protein
MMAAIMKAISKTTVLTGKGYKIGVMVTGTVVGIEMINNTVLVLS